MNKNEIIDAVKAAAKKCALEDYEIYCVEGEDISCSTYKDDIDSFSSGKNIAMFFRCIKNGKLGYATTNLAGSREIEMLVSRAAENAEISEKPEPAIIYQGGKPYRDVNNPFFELPSAEKISKSALESKDILYSCDKDVTDGTSCGAWGTSQYCLLYNSKGLKLESGTSACGAYMYVVIKNGDADPESEYDSEILSPDSFDKKAMAEKIINKAKSKLGAGKIKTGKYNIVFDRECASQILDTFHASFFANSVQKGFSKLKRDMLGTKIAADIVTIYDDPFYEKSLFKFSFDGEGYPTYTKSVIENGVLKTLLYNLTTAEKDGTESTGNASRTSSGIGTKAFTFYIKPGDENDEQLIKKAENGIFVTKMKGFHSGANTVSGDFSIESEGFLIENGIKSKPIRSFTVSGNFFELLKTISAISCETEKAYPASSVFSPALLVPGMSVAGE